MTKWGRNVSAALAIQPIIKLLLARYVLADTAKIEFFISLQILRGEVHHLQNSNSLATYL